MKMFSVDLCVACLPMRLIAIGFVRDSEYQISHTLQHRHNLFEFQFVITGHCTTKIGEELCTQKQGEVYLIAPGVFHSQKLSSAPFEKMCIIFELEKPLASSGSRAKEIFAALCSRQYYCLGADSMAETFGKIKEVLYDCDTRVCGSDEIRILTEMLILKLIQLITTPESKAPAQGSQQMQRTYIIDEFFNKNFDRNDGDKMLAETLGISIRQLNRILKSLYGHNFREKLKEIRLEVALDLLAAGKSITEISEITGYSCPANFSTFIKNSTGKTPSELRRVLNSD